MINSVIIELEYLTADSNQTNKLLLTPEDYFDLETNEKIDLDSCPKYNHAIDYIDKILKNQIVLFTKILLTDLPNKKHRQITERFWDNNNHRIIERIDMDLSKFEITYNEIIIETLTQKNPPTWEIIRLNKKEGIMQPIFHSFIEEKETGEQLERESSIEPLSIFKNLTNNNNLMTIKL